MGIQHTWSEIACCSAIIPSSVCDNHVLNCYKYERFKFFIPVRKSCLLWNSISLSFVNHIQKGTIKQSREPGHGKLCLQVTVMWHVGSDTLGFFSRLSYCAIPLLLKNYGYLFPHYAQYLNVSRRLRCLQSGQQGLRLCACRRTTWTTQAQTCVTRHCHLHRRPRLWSACMWSPG